MRTPGLKRIRFLKRITHVEARTPHGPLTEPTFKPKRAMAEPHPSRGHQGHAESQRLFRKKRCRNIIKIVCVTSGKNPKALLSERYSHLYH